MTLNLDMQEINKNEEQDIVLGLVISTDFIKRIRSMYKPEYFSLSFTKAVAAWCIEYFDKYKKAPFKDIQSIFEIKKKKYQEDKIELIDSFLNNLNNKFTEIQNYNVEFHLEEAKKYFKGMSLTIFEDKIKGLRLLSDYSNAEAEIAKYVRVEEGSHEGIDVWDKTSEQITEFVRKMESLEYNFFSYPGLLSKFIRPFKRGDFIAFMGPPARKKSWWLIETAIWGSLRGLNVLFISFEMQQEELEARIYQRLTGMLLPSPDSNEQLELEIPYFDSSITGRNIIKSKKTIKKVMQPIDIIRKTNAIGGLTKGRKLKLLCAPQDTFTIADIDSHLDNLSHYDNFIPDILCVDYADITKPDYPSIEKRHQIDQIWKGYRKIGQERNILVATVSHTNKNTFNRDVRQDDASEDSRKMNHLTWACGLNQTDIEEEQGAMRLCILKDRFHRYNKLKEALVLQCLDIGQVNLDCRIIDKRDKDN